MNDVANGHTLDGEEVIDGSRFVVRVDSHRAQEPSLSVLWVNDYTKSTHGHVIRLDGVGDDTVREFASALVFCHHTTRLHVERECTNRLAATERDRDDAIARVRHLESSTAQPVRLAEVITHDLSGSVLLAGCQHQECVHLQREIDALRRQREEVERLGRDARDRLAAAEKERDLLRDELHKAQREHEATAELLRTSKMDTEALRAALDAVTSGRDEFTGGEQLPPADEAA